MNKDLRPLAFVLTGPTGIGKSAVAAHVADRLPCDLMAMDSMQVYRGLDIGTAKPGTREQERYRYRLLDLCPPEAVYTVSAYREAAMAALREVLDSGRIPLFVGGTGLYLNALRYDLHMGQQEADPAYRRELQALSEAPGGRAALMEQLRQVDPDSAARLHENDVRRVIRALEIARVCGSTRTQLDRGRPALAEGPVRFRVFALDMEREALYARINERAAKMLEAGWQEEVRGLLSTGLTFDREDGGSSQAIGYPELEAVLRGRMSPEDALFLIRRNTRRYAKRQLTWLRHSQDITWIPMSSGPQAVAQAGDILLATMRRILEEEKEEHA